MKASALLIGNGINRAENSCGWNELLNQLQKEYGVEAAGNYTNYPLEFERIDLAALTRRSAMQNDLKRKICASLPEPESLILHSAYADLPVDTFMTTNYDYNIEKAIDTNYCEKHRHSNTTERKHSLFRYTTVKDKRIWHLHGEAKCPNSICIGYEQYCSSLSRMHEFLTKPMDGVTKSPYLHYALSSGKEVKEAWPLLFFTHDVYIVGLTLSLMEIDLWWLLSYRKRCRLREPEGSIINKIHYFYPVGKCDDEQLSLLDSMDVELHPIPLIRGNWKRLYIQIKDNISFLINT